MWLRRQASGVLYQLKFLKGEIASPVEGEEEGAHAVRDGNRRGEFRPAVGGTGLYFPNHLAVPGGSDFNGSVGISVNQETDLLQPLQIKIFISQGGSVGDVPHVTLRVVSVPAQLAHHAQGGIRKLNLVQGVGSEHVADDPGRVDASAAQGSAVQPAAGQFCLIKAAVRPSFQGFRAGLPGIGIPVCLSMIENTEGTLAFISRLEGALRKREKVFVVLKRVDKIASGAIVVLLSIMMKFRANRIGFNGDYPKNKDARQYLIYSGFEEFIYL